MILLCSISYASDSLCRKPTCSSAAAASSALPLTRSDQMVKLQQSELPSCTSPPNSHVATLSLTLFTYLLVLPTAIFLTLLAPPPPPPIAPNFTPCFSSRFCIVLCLPTLRISILHRLLQIFCLISTCYAVSAYHGIIRRLHVP